MRDEREELDECRRLWRAAFGDTEEYMDYYFQCKAPRSEIFADRMRGKLCSMAFFTFYDAMFCGRNVRIPYIVGVATERNRRHEGRMTRVLSRGIDEIKKRGCPLAFLSPADPAIYEPLGFVAADVRQTTVLTGAGRMSRRIRTWDELTGTEKEQAAAFAEQQLGREKFDLRLIRHPAYYNEINRELRSLGGDLLVLYGEKGIEGIANWIQEEGKPEITELICKKEDAAGVMESLSARSGEKPLIIDDSYFISHVEGDGIRRHRQEKPYLMYRVLEDGFPSRLKCYVNDIT